MKIWSAVSLAALTVTSAMAAEPKLDTDKAKFSYALGVNIGRQIKGDGLDVEAPALTQAITDMINGTAPRLKPEEMQAAVENVQKKRTEQKQVTADKNLKAGKEYLAKNKKEKGITELPNGMQYKVIKDGTGKQPKATDTVSVHYRGTLISGVEFDSSVSRGEPATFPVGGVIKGWQEILPLMKEGAKWQVFIPSDLAYGPNGAGASIGPNETLIFEIELLSIKG